MAVRISGVLKDGAGKPIQNCTIQLKARRNSTTVVVNTVASENPDEAGRYTMDVEYGQYSVSLLVEGFPPSHAGIITVYEDSKPGTLNDFLGAMTEDDARPEALRRFELMVEEVARNASAVEQNTAAAKKSASDAGTSAREAATHATDAAGSARAASTSAGQAATSAQSASSSAGTASTKATEASKSAAAAESSKSAAATSAGAAKTSETNAAASQKSAATSASTATTKASEAATSARDAAASKEAAKSSETSAASSASNAASSATAAGNSAKAAKTSETNADNSAQAAADSQTASANSATAAKNQKPTRKLARQQQRAAKLMLNPAKPMRRNQQPMRLTIATRRKVLLATISDLAHHRAIVLIFPATHPVILALCALWQVLKVFRLLHQAKVVLLVLLARLTEVLHIQAFSRDGPQDRFILTVGVQAQARNGLDTQEKMKFLDSVIAPAKEQLYFHLTIKVQGVIYSLMLAEDGDITVQLIKIGSH